MKSTFVRWGAVALMIGTLAGCGGGGGGGDTTAPPGGDGAPPGGGGAPSVTPPTGAAPITLTAATPAATFAALAPVVKVGGVSISSTTQVAFSIADANNNPIIGFGSTAQSSTATLPSYSNLAFALAKLVPGTNAAPSKWVSYIVTTVPSKNATTGAITAAAPSRPSTDNTGTLVDNKNGTYTYTFYRDITQIKSQVAAMTVTAPNNKADLGDLTYEPNLTHRLTIQVSGNAPGSGTNTPNGVQVTPGVPMANPVNFVYDFIPATGKAVAATDLQRNVVAVQNCNECHQQLALHGGGRFDPNYCVVCHTDQRKYGYTNVASTAGKFPALTETVTVNATTGITSYSYSPETRIADGEVAGNFTTLVHKIHQGAELVKENYNYANVAFNNKGYSMLGGGQKMCTKCHDNTKAKQADNWNTQPSRIACGACHDGINWATGKGSTLVDKAAATAVGAVVATSGHVGGAQSGDATCALCHSADSIKVYHQTENVTKHNPTVTAGLKNFAYEIKSAAVNATSNDVTVVFKITADGSAVTFLPAAAGMANPLAGFTGGPSFLLAWAQSQDGITTPADYNNAGRKQAQAISVTLASLLDTAKAADGSLSGPDASGYYTTTLKGSGANKFPVGAKMRAVALNGYFTQVSPAASRHAISVIKEVTGDTVRRKVVDPDKCANCHEWFEGHGGNRVYQTQVCVTCHVPGMATSGRGISDAALAAYTFNAADTKILTGWGFNKTLPNAALKFPVTTNNFKDMIHGIHAGRDRVNPFVDARDRTPSSITLLDFKRMDFPGVLKNCETCHVAGTYSNVPANALASMYESIDAAYDAAITGGTATPAIAKTALNTANVTDHVVSPFAAACISCHDAASTQGHVGTNNGVIQQNRSVFQTNAATPGRGEACATCHGAGKAEDVAVVHKR